MYLQVRRPGEIIVTRLGTNMMTAYRKAPDRPNLVLTRSWLEPTVQLARDKRVSRPRLSGSDHQGARAGVDCVKSRAMLPTEQAIRRGFHWLAVFLAAILLVVGLVLMTFDVGDLWHPGDEDITTSIGDLLLGAAALLFQLPWRSEAVVRALGWASGQALSSMRIPTNAGLAALAVRGLGVARSADPV